MDIKEIRALIPKQLSGTDKFKLPCIRCGNKRWVSVTRARQSRFSGMCAACALHKKNKERYIRKLSRRRSCKPVNGYYIITLPENDPYIMMANEKNRVLEHRLVVAENVGRCLESWEIVHHINGIKTDNRIENLELHDGPTHQRITILEMEINRLRERVLNLEIENSMLMEDSYT